MEGRIYSDTSSALEDAEQSILRMLGSEKLASEEMPLSKTVPFNGFNDSELSKLKMCRQEFGEGDFVIKQGEKADGLYVLVKGKVSVLREDVDSGISVSLVNYGPGVSVGEIAILTSDVRTADVKAMQPSVLYFLTVENFLKIQKEEPTIALKLLLNLSTSLASRLSSASTAIQTLETT